MTPEVLFRYIVAAIAGIGVGVFILGVLLVAGATLWGLLHD